MAGFQQLGYGAVSNLTPSAPVPTGNADTITNALGPWNRGPGRNAAARALVYKAALTGFLADYTEPSCRGLVGSGSSLGGDLLKTGIAAGLSAIPFVGGALSKFVGFFGAHHQAAVKLEQSTLCQAVPDANNFLRQIDSWVSTGQMDVATAVKALEEGYSNWRVEVKAVLQDTGGKCNYACQNENMFRAAIEKRKQDYAIVVSQNSAGGQGVVGGVVSAIKTSGVYSGIVQAANSAADAVTNAARSVVSSFSNTSLPSSTGSTATAQAGLTPARQNSLAVFLAVGVALLSVALFSNFFGGKGK